MTSKDKNFRRILAAAAIVMSLAGCGFQPLHGTNRAGSASQADLSAVQIDLIANREGQMLRNELLDRFQPTGPAAKPRYVLSVGLSVQRIGLGIRTDETATRASLVMVADYSVRDAATGTVMFHGRGRSVSGYNVLDSEFATLSGETDAIRRTVLDISQQITTRVSLVITGEGGGTPRPS